MHCPTRLSPFSRRLAPADRVRLSWGSSSLRRVAPGCPCLPRPAEPTAGGEGCQPLARAALGLSQPLGGFSRVASERLGSPRTPPRRRSPRNFAALSHAATPLGFSLQSLPLSESRAAFRRPSAPLRVRPRPETGAEAPVRRERFPPSATGRAVRQVREDPRRDRGVGLGFLRSPRPSITARVAPHGERDDRPETPGSQGSWPCRPLRSFAPSESPFTRRAERSPSLRPSHETRSPGRCSPGVSPFWSLPHHVPGSVLPRGRPANRAPPTRRAPFRNVGTRAVTPRPRPSRSGDSVGWPSAPRHRQTLRASAPPLGGAPASLALHPRRAA